MLRSREIMPVDKPKTPGKALDFGAFEPDTPAKTAEGLNEKLSVSPSTANQELGSTAARRRSVRLASKSNLALTEVVEDVKFSSQKRKQLDSGDNVIISNVLNLDTLKGENQRDIEKGDLHFGANEVRVADGIVPKTEVLEDKRPVGVVARFEETRLEANDPASFAELRTPGWSDGGDESMRRTRRKRKSGTQNLLGLEHSWQGESEKRFLNLRSGKRIEKIGANNSHEEVGIVNGDLDCSKQNRSSFKDCGANAGARSRSVADAKEADSDSSDSGMKFSREEKGKFKVLEDSVTRGVGMMKLGVEVKEVDGNKTAIDNEMHAETRSTGKMDKGKGKLVDIGISSESIFRLDCKSETGVELENGGTASETSNSTPPQDVDSIIKEAISRPYGKRTYQERFRNIAKQNASRFAHFSSQVEEEENNDVADTLGTETPTPARNAEPEDWPGPFSTAVKIIRDRQMNASLQLHNSSDKSKVASILWVPKKDQNCNLQKKLVPSLQDLCLSILVKNADAITSLDCIPDVLRHKLSHLLCNSRRMDRHFLELLVHGSPTEIHLRDCSWLNEEDFSMAFERCDISKLMVSFISFISLS